MGQESQGGDEALQLGLVLSSHPTRGTLVAQAMSKAAIGPISTGLGFTLPTASSKQL